MDGCRSTARRVSEAASLRRGCPQPSRSHIDCDQSAQNLCRRQTRIRTPQGRLHRSRTGVLYMDLTQCNAALFCATITKPYHSDWQQVKTFSANPAVFNANPAAHCSRVSKHTDMNIRKINSSYSSSHTKENKGNTRKGCSSDTSFRRSKLFFCRNTSHCSLPPPNHQFFLT